MSGIHNVSLYMADDMFTAVRNSAGESGISAWIRDAIRVRLGGSYATIGKPGRPRLSDADRIRRKRESRRKSAERRRITRKLEKGLAAYREILGPDWKAKLAQRSEEIAEFLPVATTPEAAHFRPVSLNSARHCIDCAHCTTTGKCSRFGLRLNGPHVCDCFQEGG